MRKRAYRAVHLQVKSGWFLVEDAGVFEESQAVVVIESVRKDGRQILQEEIVDRKSKENCILLIRRIEDAEQLKRAWSKSAIRIRLQQMASRDTYLLAPTKRTASSIKRISEPVAKYLEKWQEK